MFRKLKVENDSAGNRYLLIDMISIVSQQSNYKEGCLVQVSQFSFVQSNKIHYIKVINLV